jgi:hypothetical protein
MRGARVTAIEQPQARQDRSSTQSVVLHEIEWAPSAGSLTCEIGWVGMRKVFTIIDRKYELALHPRIPGRDGIPLRSETFSVAGDRVSRERAREEAGMKARLRAAEMWREFLLDLATSRVGVGEDQAGNAPLIGWSGSGAAR